MVSGKLGSEKAKSEVAIVNDLGGDVGFCDLVVAENMDASDCVGFWSARAFADAVDDNLKGKQ